VRSRLSLIAAHTEVEKVGLSGAALQISDKGERTAKIPTAEAPGRLYI